MQSIIESAITNKEFHEIAAAPGSNLAHVVELVDLAETTGVDTIVDIASGSGVAWGLPVKGNGATTKRFNPPLQLTENQPLQIRSRETASIEGAIHYSTKSSRSVKIQNYSEIVLPSYSYTRKTPVSGTRYGLFDGTNDVVTLGDPWTLTIDDPWTIAITQQFNGGTGVSDKFFSAESLSPAFGISLEVGTAYAPKLIIRNFSGTPQYLESQANLDPRPFGTWGNLVVDYDGSRTNAGIRMWVKGTAATMTQVFNNLSGSAQTGSVSPLIASNGGAFFAPISVLELMVWEGGASDATIAAFNAGTEITEQPTIHINFNDSSGTTVTALQGSNGTLTGDDGTNFWKVIA